ncbi:MAG TPA: hypothetical protein VGQ98_01185, partial [Gemmatimonadaceae bacterium]|nr:hypothetical protein [Gemmatimonadaceae bacterium]
VLRTTLHPELGVFLRGAALLGLLSLVHPLPEKTLLDGTAVPCADSRETTSGVPGVHVYAFNTKKIPAIRKSLFVLDTLDWESGDPDAMRAAAVQYDRLLSLVRGARTLGYATSNGNGDFEITVTQTDSVLVFGEAKMPGEPFYYSSKVVGATGQEEVRVMLLMCNQLL